MPLPLSLERAARRMEELIVATYVGHCLIDDEVTSINNKLKPGLTSVKDVLLGNYMKWEVFVSHQKFAADGWISLCVPTRNPTEASPDRQTQSLTGGPCACPGAKPSSCWQNARSLPTSASFPAPMRWGPCASWFRCLSCWATR